MNEHQPGRFGLRALLLVMLICGLALAAILRFPAIAIRSDGMLVAAFMSIIGFIIGFVIGGQKGANAAALVFFLVFFWAVLNGLIPGTGDELTMWAFLCTSGGLAIGVLYRLSSSPPSSETIDEADDLRN